MPRLPVVLASVVLVASLIGVASQTAAQEPSETVTVPPGMTNDDTVLLSTVFQVDPSTGESVVVPMTVSGTISLKEPCCEAQVYDAFYCFEGCDGVKQSDGLSFAHDQGTGPNPDLDYSHLSSFVKGNTSGNFVATPEYNPSHTYTFPFTCDENSQIACTQLRALAVPFANPPAADIAATGSLTVSLGGAPAATCTAVEGFVTDQQSRPVPGAHVRLESAGTISDEAATGTNGAYRLAAPSGPAGELRVVLLAEEYVHTPSRFRIALGAETIGAKSPPIDSTCLQDFAMKGLAKGITPIPENADVPSAFGAFQTMDEAWTLATRLQPEPTRGLPIPVYMYCVQATAPPGVLCPADPGVHFHTVENTQPFIAVAPTWSPSTPDDMRNMLGHEFGHFFMWSAFGGTPYDPATTNHAGYYKNPNSTDSWTEGFASFYSLMMRRQVWGQPEATVVGSRGDMEGDQPAWRLSGTWDEFSVVGTLLDLADGPQETVGGDDRPVPGEIEINAARDLFAAEVPPDTPLGTPWRAELLAGSGRRLGTIRGAVVEWKGLRIAIGALPGTPFDSVRLVLRPAGRPDDDDPIDGDLFDLWRAIFEFRSMRPLSANVGNHLFDIQDLYHASQLLYGSDQDRDGDGTTDVDEIFINHGFFEDTADGVSNQKWDPGERVGYSSHSQRKIDNVVRPAMIPRTSPPVLPELQARVDTGGVDATALVQVDFPDPNGDASLAVLVTPEAEGLVSLPVPPPGSGAKVSVIALAPDHQPAAVLEVDPETFWPEAERNPGRSFLSASVTMEPGDILLRDDTDTTGSAGGESRGFWAVLTLISALIGVAALFLFLRARRDAPS